MNSGIASPLTALHRSIKALEVVCDVCAFLHAKAVFFPCNASIRQIEICQNILPKHRRTAFTAELIALYQFRAAFGAEVLHIPLLPF